MRPATRAVSRAGCRELSFESSTGQTVSDLLITMR